jgi:putative peptidoglycan lipid II flippase
LLVWGNQHFDWIALREQRLLRAGLLALMVVGAAAIYFGALRITGLKLRSFLRH